MSQSSHFLSCRQRTTTPHRRHRARNHCNYSIPATPFHHYHSAFDHPVINHGPSSMYSSGKYTIINVKDGFERNGFHGGFSGRNSVSARRLAASLQNLQSAESIHNFGSKENEMRELCYPERAIEEATRWDPKFLRACSRARSSCHHRKHLVEQVNAASVAAGVRAEVLHARHCVRELQKEDWSSESKVEYWLRRLEEDSFSQQKVNAVVDELNNELCRERKSRETLEILNSKLIKELAKTKSYVEHVMNDYLKERKARQVMEEVCIDLADKVEDKTKNKLAKIESIRLQEEVMEEFRMLQMIEVWREERVQMRMLEAKLALEDKSCQMNKLIDELETVLVQSRSIPAMDILDLRTADLLIQEAKVIDIKNVEEFNDLAAESDELFNKIEAVEQIPERLIMIRDSSLLVLHLQYPIINCVLKGPATHRGNADIDEHLRLKTRRGSCL